jgi:hypothetical protein
VTTLDQPSQRGSTPWRIAATAGRQQDRRERAADEEEAGVLEEPASVRLKLIPRIHRRERRRAGKRVPARINTDAAKPPAKATRAAEETAGPAR